MRCVLFCTYDNDFSDGSYSETIPIICDDRDETLLKLLEDIDQYTKIESERREKLSNFYKENPRPTLTRGRYGGSNPRSLKKAEQRDASFDAECKAWQEKLKQLNDGSPRRDKVTCCGHEIWIHYLVTDSIRILTIDEWFASECES